MVLETNHRPPLYCSSKFEQLYTDLRRAEHRIYSDEEVSRLPHVEPDHVYSKEWEIRKSSCDRLVRYLKDINRPLKILEIGCGNGWLSHRLSQIPSSYVIGIDVNLLELQQAERVFATAANLAFVYGDIDSAFLERQKFDVVVFAAAIQYFESLPDIIGKAFGRLNEDGEIHIVDSHFYGEEEIATARQRSVAYFKKKGFERMGAFYFHRSLDELSDFRYSILYNPNSIVSRVFRSKNPFHWIRIK
ncbi:MAG: class I SAM-dependent methyltransferase [Flavisolibacter sp.]